MHRPLLLSLLECCAKFWAVSHARSVDDSGRDIGRGWNGPRSRRYSTERDGNAAWRVVLARGRAGAADSAESHVVHGGTPHIFLF